MTNTPEVIDLVGPHREVQRLLAALHGAELIKQVSWNSLFGEPDPEGESYSVIATVQFPAGWYIGAGNRSNPEHTELAIADPGGQNRVFLMRVVSLPDILDRGNTCYLFRVGQLNPEPASSR